jgi:hypothetical protein
MQAPERVVPSLVRLQIRNQAHRLAGHALYLSDTVGFVFLDVLADWESDAATPRSLTSREDQLPNKVIKCRSEVVNRITDNCGPFGPWLSGALKPEDDLPGVIILSDQSIRLDPAKRQDSVIEVSDVLIGPFNLEVDSD